MAEGWRGRVVTDSSVKFRMSEAEAEASRSKQKQSKAVLTRVGTGPASMTHFAG